MEAILHSRPRDLRSLPAGPRAPSIVQVAGYLGDPIGYVERCRERFGPVFTLRWPGMAPMVYFTEPEPIRAIFRAPPDVLQAGRSNSVLDFIAGPRSLARLDGDAHKQRRRGMVPPFSRLGQAYVEAMAANTLALFEARALGQPNRPVAFRELSQSLSLRNLIRCALGIVDPERATRLHDLMLTFMRESLNPVMAALWMAFPGVELRKLWVRRLPFSTLGATIRELDELLHQTIAEARASADSSERTDVLSLLVRMHGELTAEDLRDELMAILVAGHETTSTTMDWFMVETLARPAVLERVREELDRVVGDGPVTLAHVGELGFLDAVIHECLRLHPPVPAVGRYVAQELTIAGVTLPVGVIASPSIALLHRDPRVWPDPLAFRPERWFASDVDKRSFIAFGGGARTCLGKPFGLFQLQVVLATLLSRFELQPGRWPSAKQVQRGLFTGVGHPVWLRVGLRGQFRGGLRERGA